MEYKRFFLGNFFYFTLGFGKCTKICTRWVLFSLIIMKNGSVILRHTSGAMSTTSGTTRYYLVLRSTTSYDVSHYEVLWVIQRVTTRYYEWYFEVLWGTTRYCEFYYESLSSTTRNFKYCQWYYVPLRCLWHYKRPFRGIEWFQLY